MAVAFQPGQATLHDFAFPWSFQAAQKFFRDPLHLSLYAQQCPTPPTHLQAAVTVAKRVADEMQVELGSKVGYAVRFEDCSSPDTKMKYLTGKLLALESFLS